jgi:hypothetical protein
LIKKYQLERIKAKTEYEVDAIARRYPGLYFAEEIYHRTDVDTRWIIEARLLANEPLDIIATKVNASTDTILCYERTFFSVLHNLHRPDWVATAVIGKSIHKGLKDREYDTLWKCIGYGLGPIMLDGMINPVTPHQHLTDVKQVTPAASTLVGTFMTHKALMAAATWPTAFNQRDIVELFKDLLNIEKNSGGGESTRDLMTESVRVMFETLHGTIRTQATLGKSPVIYDGRGSELRADEQFLITLRQSDTPPVDDFVFPEVTHGNPEDQ